MTTPVAVVHLGLLLARIGAFATVFPPAGNQAPRLVRVGLTLALFGFYAGVAAPELDQAGGRAAEVHPLMYAVALFREALLGASLGYAFGLFLLPARVAGEFLTQQIGLNVSPQSGPTGNEPAGAFTRAFETVAALVFLCLDGHHVALSAFHATFALMPLGGPLVTPPQVALGGLASAYEMGLLLAGPLSLCLFLLSVTMAVMARAAPQLSIYSVGFTLQVLTVLVGGLLLLPDLVLAMQGVVARTGADLTATLR